MITSECGHYLMGLVNQCGPFQHVEEDNSSGDFPRLAISVGLSSDDT